ncbi:MAG: hypothetical protein AAGH65_07060 [Pseudomonadota bacterium]
MKFSMAVVLLFLFGCASTNYQLEPSSNALAIIDAAAQAAPDGVSGEFEFAIQAAGRERGVVYLNTELDYRDRRNISVAIQPHLVRYFEREFGRTPEQLFINQRIQVFGEARQVRIDFVANGRRTDKYYFQTHINVTSPDQIKLL